MSFLLICPTGRLWERTGASRLVLLHHSGCRWVRLHSVCIYTSAQMFLRSVWCESCSHICHFSSWFSSSWLLSQFLTDYSSFKKTTTRHRKVADFCHLITSHRDILSTVVICVLSLITSAHLIFFSIFKVCICVYHDDQWSCPWMVEEINSVSHKSKHNIHIKLFFHSLIIRNIQSSWYSCN